ncbi:hypothetical protein TNIN_288611 [Trichonephila inaurata madagascariensis]|uniref:Secreted protein n=1 Tax=Trichonephila inaurata madagascariensis TaxID=2747483 RepID=A0A8X6YSH2_9ARAC|nr:hypothetical protein TNIN_288611 [Trichonephila inaurata madagascariensis]
MYERWFYLSSRIKLVFISSLTVFVPSTSQCTPDKTLAFKEERHPDRKLGKDRVACLLELTWRDSKSILLKDWKHSGLGCLFLGLLKNESNLTFKEHIF